MKADTVKVPPTTVDRLATADEILAAVLSFPDPIEQCAAELLSEIPADFGGYVRIPFEELDTPLIEELIRHRDTRPN